MIRTTYCRPSLYRDVKELAPKLRESDVLELQASTGDSPHAALTAGIELSDLVYTLISKGEVVAMGGVAPHECNSAIGIAWLLASDGLRRSAVALQRSLPAVLEEMQALYPTLTNFVDARNTISIEWLKHLGFRLVGTDEHYGVARVPFHWFVRGKDIDLCVPQPPQS